MRFSLIGLIRLLMMSSLGLTALAVWLGGLAPSVPFDRSPSIVTHVNLNGLFFAPDDVTSRWLNPSTGEVTKLELPERENLEFGTCSPWLDESGSYNVVGRWRKRTGVHQSQLQEDLGIVRMRFPSGEILERITTDVVPIGTPCWYPAPSARLLFAAGDGFLHTLSFDAPEGERIPRPIVWKTKRPGTGTIYLSDPAWIDAGSPNPCLAVCLRSVERDTARRGYTAARLWWIRLSTDGSSIIAAGPLLTPRAGDEETETRCPVVFRGKNDEGYRLAYCRRSQGRNWEVRIASLDRKANNGGYTIPNMGRVVIDSCLPMQAAFSLDGRWLSTMRGDVFRTRELIRAAVDPEREGLASADPTATGL